MDEYRITPETLHHQARVAREHANPQLAANFERAAELTGLGDDEVLSIYEALRPGRSTGEELDRIVADLRARGAERSADLVRGARQAYAARGLLRSP